MTAVAKMRSQSHRTSPTKFCCGRSGKRNASPHPGVELAHTLPGGQNGGLTAITGRIRSAGRLLADRGIRGSDDHSERGERANRGRAVAGSRLRRGVHPRWIPAHQCARARPGPAGRAPVQQRNQQQFHRGRHRPALRPRGPARGRRSTAPGDPRQQRPIGGRSARGGRRQPPRAGRIGHRGRGQRVGQIPAGAFRQHRPHRRRRHPDRCRPQPRATPVGLWWTPKDW